MPPRNASILLVDDDIGLLRMTRRMLELEGYRIATAGSGEAALEIFTRDLPDLVLLDVIMPGMDGYTICRRISESSKVPVIMVTCKGSEEEKLAGFEAGADDYVTKPFSCRELAARVKTVLRRVRWPGSSRQPTFQNMDLTVDFFRQRVTLANRDIDLTATEYHLISYLARNGGQVLTANQILESVWGAEYIGESHMLHVNMARLRQKIMDDNRNPRYIATRPGIGYMMLQPA